MGDSHHNPSFCRSIQLGENNSRHSDGLVKKLGLGDGILPCGGIENQPDLMRGPGKFSTGHAMDLLQLLHEIDLGVKAARRID